MSDFDEVRWWGDCANTFHEEQKQLVLAQLMDLLLDWDTAHPPTIVHSGSVGDVGGGPVSLLLKMDRGIPRAVIDPGEYPQWVLDRYRACDINWVCKRGEDMGDGKHTNFSFDEVWLYNVLQHVDDPELVVRNARISARGRVRVAEYINIPAYDGHPHELHKDDLDAWLGGKGRVTYMNAQGAVGEVYHGVFPSH